METPDYYLIHANVAVAREALDHPTMSGFVQMADEIDAIARSSPGFVSQPTPVDEGSTFTGNHLLNLSIWESVEHLRDFTFSNEHKLALSRREEWFVQAEKYNYVFYWAERDHQPTENEVLRRLDYLRQNGPSPFAFTFEEPFSMEEAIDFGLDRPS